MIQSLVCLEIGTACIQGLKMVFFLTPYIALRIEAVQSLSVIQGTASLVCWVVHYLVSVTFVKRV
jgi:hypothetical protein